MTKENTIDRLMRMNCRVITNSESVIVAELGPEGFSSGGKPLTQPLRVEFRFNQGKLVQTIF